MTIKTFQDGIVVELKKVVDMDKNKEREARKFEIKNKQKKSTSLKSKKKKLIIRNRFNDALY